MLEIVLGVAPKVYESEQTHSAAANEMHTSNLCRC